LGVAIEQRGLGEMRMRATAATPPSFDPSARGAKWKVACGKIFVHSVFFSCFVAGTRIKIAFYLLSVASMCKTSLYFGGN